VTADYQLREARWQTSGRANWQFTRPVYCTHVLHTYALTKAGNNYNSDLTTTLLDLLSGSNYPSTAFHQFYCISYRNWISSSWTWFARVSDRVQCDAMSIEGFLHCDQFVVYALLSDGNNWSVHCYFCSGNPSDNDQLDVFHSSGIAVTVVQYRE